MQLKNNCLKMISLLKAKAPFIYIPDNDEGNTVKQVRESVLSLFLNQEKKGRIKMDNIKYYEWSVSEGLKLGELTKLKTDSSSDAIWKNVVSGDSVDQLYSFSDESGDQETRDPITALEKFQNEKAKGKDENILILVMKDLHNIIKNNPNLIRKIKDIVLSTSTKNVTRHIIMLSPIKEVPVDLRNNVNYIDWKLPDAEDITEFLKKIADVEIVEESFFKTSKDEAKNKNKYTDLQFKDILNSLIGLPLVRIEEHTALCYAENAHRLDSRFLTQLKTKNILENSSLELLDTGIHMNEVGGMDRFKQWVDERTKAFSKEAIEFGIESPKGVLLVGIQGCGKTMMAKAMSSIWSLPLVKFDPAKVFSKTIGSSEENIRQTLATIDALSPCVVLIDEIEKGLSGTQSSNASDGGTTSRVVGTLLSWMQDKTSQAFIIATANDVSQLPPELLRKGRFDEIFFCSLPEDKEREEIFRIHLTRRGQDSKDINVSKLVKSTNHYSGSEIEQIVKTAKLLSFNDGKKKITTEHMEEAVKKTIPLYATCEEDIQWLLQWVSWDDERGEGLRARFASSPAMKIHADPKEGLPEHPREKTISKFKPKQ